MKPILYCLLLSSLFVQAGVEVDTSVNDVYHCGSSELLGSMSFRFAADEIPNASEEEPHFIRITPDHNSSLAATLVNLNSTEPNLNRPIHLALYTHTNNASISVVAPREAVSIVRWVAGESSIWIRITSPTSAWLSNGTEAVMPSEEHPVEFSLGLSGYHTVNVPENQRNLPFNLRQYLGTSGSEGTSTAFCADLDCSVLLGDGSVESLIYLDLIGFGPDAQISEGVYSGAGATILGLNFSGSFIVARGKMIDYDISPEDVAPLSLSRPYQNEEPLYVRNQLPIQMNHTSGGNFLSLSLGEESSFSLSVPDDADYGFVPGRVALGNGMLASVSYEDPLTISNETVYRKAMLTYQGWVEPLNDLTVLLDVTLSLNRSTLATSLEVTHSVGIRRGNALCPPSFVYSDLGTWTLGEIGTDRIIPHITNPSGDFTSKLYLANTGDVESEVGFAIYDDEGNNSQSMLQMLGSGEVKIVDLDGFIPENGGYLRITDESPVVVSVVYQAKGEDKSRAELHETSAKSSKWRLYSGSAGLTFDGAAVVNMGDEDAFLTIIQKNLLGETLNTVTQGLPLAAGHKDLLVLDSLFPAVDGAYYEISAGQPLAVTALRGDLQSNFLWENQALPLD